jgi:hypothetical protein
MSISPPSDIVLDVARAADPTRYTEAAAQLKRVAASSAAASGFGDMMTAFNAEDISPMAEDALSAVQDLASRATAAAPPESVLRKPDGYSAFEAMMLTGFIEAMMPKDSAAVFGSGNAGQIWASMMAEQVAAKVSDAGGIGIADRLRSADAARNAAIGSLDPAVPTNADTIVGTVAAASERGFLAALRPDFGGSAANSVSEEA